MKRAITAIVLLAAITTSAQAELLHKDNFTRDTDSGLDWLDFRDTAGRSIEQVQNGAGGFIDAGWRFATPADIQDLFTRATGLSPTVSADGNTGAWQDNPPAPAYDATIALINYLTPTIDDSRQNSRLFSFPHPRSPAARSLTYATIP